MRLLILSFIFLFPFSSHAAVVINEIAWMGNANSANDEWIELYNDGSTVNVDGWTLSDGMNLEIELQGAVGALEYAVLERTDDASAPGSAFLIYTGALPNTGATLTLRRADGSIEDQVAGGDNWENIGGDNTTKETAQYTSSGWVTGVATPGRQNVSFSTSPNEERDDSDDEQSTVTATKSTKKSSENVKLVLPDWELDLTLEAPTVAYVHQPVSFSVEPSGVDEGLFASLKYSWNMGDLETYMGDTITHQYEYPGKYVVVLTGEYARHAASVRHTITVLPVTFSMTTNAQGDIQIHNDAKYEVDLSGFSVQGKRTVVFPENTILLPNATLTIPKNKIGGTYAFLMDQANTLVASMMPSPLYVAEAEVEDVEVETVARQPAAAAPPIAIAPPSKPTPQISAINSNFRFADDPAPQQAEVLHASDFAIAAPIEAEASDIQNTALAAEADVPIPNDKLPYLGLIAIIGLGIIALYAGRVR